MLSGSHIASALAAVPGATGGQYASTDQIAAAFNEAMALAPKSFKSAVRVRALLSSCLMESGWYRYLTEQSWGSKDLRLREYWPFIGRTLIQLTWLANYRAFGGWLYGLGLVDDPEVFVKNPAALADPKWAALGPVWYCAVRQINGKTPIEWAAADSDPAFAIAACVYLGTDPDTARAKGLVPAGMNDRRRAWAAFEAAGEDLSTMPADVYTGPMSVTAFALNVRMGPSTLYAITDQLANGRVVETTGDAFNGWVEVVYVRKSPGGGWSAVVGWCSRAYLKEIS